MAIIHARGIPNSLHRRIAAMAEDNGRSLSAEVIDLLKTGVENKTLRARQGRLLLEIRRHRVKLPQGTKDSVSLIREDRDR